MPRNLEYCWESLGLSFLFFMWFAIADSFIPKVQFSTVWLQEPGDGWIRDGSVNSVCPAALRDPSNMRLSHLVIFLAVMPQCSDSFCCNCQAKLFLMMASIYSDAVHLGFSCKHPYVVLHARRGWCCQSPLHIWTWVSWITAKCREFTTSCLPWDHLLFRMKERIFHWSFPDLKSLPTCDLWLVRRDRCLCNQALLFPSIAACCQCMNCQGIWPMRILAS